MNDFVRVKSKSTGHEFTVARARANQTPDLDIVDKPATNLNGEPVHPKLLIRVPKTQKAVKAANQTSEEDK